ncbi:hypothetical protein KFK09_005762 [Dendrobium nobile]|uniref:Uncharacterized protein n=1 Tax=Dendrobium nobile TaxID=94219 RepID=A0A8T3BWQ6_DENNO|nr:hypothetical protein KFK09_005762 [Dendrobium nobile]
MYLIVSFVKIIKIRHFRCKGVQRKKKTLTGGFLFHLGIFLEHSLQGARRTEDDPKTNQGSEEKRLKR